MRKIIWISLCSTALIAFIFFVILPYQEEQKEIKHYAFKLKSNEGMVKLSDFQGKIAVIYFGYMYCPDICPTSLSVISSAIAQLPKDKALDVQLLFISIDPQRDKIKELDAYARYFHASAIGLTEEKSVLKRVSESYGSYYAKEPSSDADNYAVAHTSYIYFMDKKGKLAHRLSHTQEPKAVLEVLLKML